MKEYTAQHKVLYKRRPSLFDVTIGEAKIELKSKSVIYTLKYCDVIGATFEVSKDPDDTRAFLNLYHHPIKNRKYTDDPAVIILSDGSRDTNEKRAEELETLIRNRLGRGGKVLNYLILVNPASGTGQSLKVYAQFATLLKEANIKHRLVKTEYRGHAAEIARETDLSSIDAVITVSGDGLFHEMINGLLSREEHKENLPKVGIVPAGSGNGLVNSFLHESKLKSDARRFAMFKMVKFQSRPLDLLHVESGELNKYCMLSCMLGLIADIDHDSDNLRSWGAIRFDIYAVIKILQKRKYPFKLELYDHEDQLIDTDEDKFWAVCFGVAPLIDAKTRLFPNCVKNNGTHMVCLKSSATRVNVAGLWSDLEAGKHAQREFPHVTHLKVKRAKVTSPVPVTVVLDGEPYQLAELNITDMPNQINTLF